MPLNTNDPVVLTIAFVLGAVFNSDVGLLSAEIRARQDERRTIERERRAEAARDRREGDDLVRASRLRAIEETQRYCEHLFASMHAQISGDTERMREQHQELSRLPKADLSLLGDAELYRAVSEFGLAMDKLEGPVDVLAGNRLLHTLASMQARVNTAFRLQEEATLRGEAPKRLEEGVVVESFAEWDGELRERGG